jgi:hypothetical protein
MKSSFLKKTRANNWRVVWLGQYKTQESVTFPPGTTQAQAEDFMARFDQMRTEGPTSSATAEWLARLPDAIHGRLVYYKLAKPRQVNQTPTKDGDP